MKFFIFGHFHVWNIWIENWIFLFLLFVATCLSLLVALPAAIPAIFHEFPFHSIWFPNLFPVEFLQFSFIEFFKQFSFFVAPPASTTAIVHESKFSNAIQGNQIELIKTIQFHLITLLIAIFLMKIYRFFLLCQKLAKILCRKMLHYAIPQVAVTF